MKHLLYSHSVVQSILGASWRAVSAITSSRLAPIVSRLLPGRRGRRLTAYILLGVGLVAQAFMIFLLAELVELCISLYEVWALLARKYVELS